MKFSYTYFLTNKNKTVLYTGATGNLKNRIKLHIEGKGAKFTKKYSAFELVYYEKFEKYEDAFSREKQLKAWRKSWKWDLIKKFNPGLKNLYLEL